MLLKFIETTKQWSVIKNSYVALNNGGVAIHVLDKDDYSTNRPKLNQKILPYDYYPVLLSALEAELQKQHITYKKIPLPYGVALVLQK